MLFRSKGNSEEKQGGFVSKLIEVDYVHKDAVPDHDIPAHHVYRLIFEDKDGEKTERFALELKEGQSLTNNFLNSLLGIPLLGPGQQIYFRIYEKDGNTNIYMAESSEQGSAKLEWRYGWNKDEKWFFDVPKPVETTQMNPQTGKFVWDYSLTTAFWRKQFLEVIYPALNGKPWVAPRDEAKAKITAGRMLANIKEKNPTMIETAWPAMANFIKDQLSHPDDRKVVLQAIQAEYDSKFGLHLLNIDGGMTPRGVAPTHPPAAIDDLPF